VQLSRLEKRHVCVLRLTLQDDTASLPASLSYHDFEEFFQVEQKAMLSEEAIRKCEQQLASLTVPGAIANLCLKSWEASDGQVRFAVFASSMAK
jgi:hypothetical protein